MQLEQQLIVLASAVPTKAIAGSQPGIVAGTQPTPGAKAPLEEKKTAAAKRDTSPAAMRERIIFSGTEELESPESLCLAMCTCHPLEKRAEFIVKLITDIKKTYPDTNQPLVYTSLAAGSCLQDFLTIQELFEAGYQNLVINIIDLYYPDFKLLPRTATERAALQKQLIGQHAQFEEEAKKKGLQTNLNLPKKEHETLEQLKNLERIENFRAKVEHLFFNALQQKTDKTVALKINFYTNIDDYLVRAERYQEDKSNVLVMVDPGQSALSTLPEGQERFYSNANAFTFTHGQTDKLLLFLPHYGPLQLYGTKERIALHTALDCIYNKLYGNQTIARSKLHEISAQCNIKMEPRNDIRLVFQDLFFLAATKDCVAYQMYAGFPSRYDEIKTVKITRDYYEKDNETAAVAGAAGFRYRLI